ncbi:hypothetical protein HMPREF9489_1563 [Finegoldia magna SY403409CC001050417]|nr:hypothetical protein HMPREF9489_1563 [Finegoldia magna SY403409CC001050417]
MLDFLGVNTGLFCLFFEVYYSFGGSVCMVFVLCDLFSSLY